MTFVAIIPAGGAGTRLWPLSRREHPKFLLDLTGTGNSLLQETIARLTPLVDHILVVTGRAHVQEVRAQTGLEADAIIAEPEARNSMPAIQLAAEIAANRWGKSVVVGSFAADHTIADRQAFASAIQAARSAAAAGYLTTLGITPTYPATGFGYIAAGNRLPGRAGKEGGAIVSQFTEKPPLAQAQAWLAEGNYFWNAGIFIAQYATLRRHLVALHPDFAANIAAIAAGFGESDERELARAWRALPSISIDHALAEPVAQRGGVAVVPTSATLGWDDLGDFTSLQSHARRLPTPRVVVAGGTAALVIDRRSDRSTPLPVVATLGIDDAVVVLSDDGYLVTTLAHAQQVGELPALLAERGLGEVT